MEKKKINWVTPILATFTTIFLSYVIGRMFAFTSFAFSWGLNFLLMAWYTFFVSQINLKLDSSYFNSKPFEKEGKIYTYLGVHIYRKLLVWVGWEKVSRQKNPIKNSIDSLKNSEYNTRTSELGHTIIALIISITTIGIASSLNEAKWLIILNVFLNIYPVMVQRYNRPRYQKIFTIRSEKKNLFRHNP